MPELRICLLGGAHLAWAPAAGAVHLSRPSLHLLGFLLLHREHVQSRERLTAILWDEIDEDRARRRLSTALWRLRRALSPPARCPECLLFEPGGAVGINPECAYWLDVAALETTVREVCAQSPGAVPAAAVVALERVLDLYQGELLPDCGAGWLLPERQRLEVLYLGALEWLLEHRRATGEIPAAIAAGRRLLQWDPLREDIHRALMALYAAAGRRRQAIRHYDYCRDLLASELGVGPMPETDALYRRVLRDAPCPPAGPALPAQAGEVIARLEEQLDAAQRELARLRRLLGVAAADGKG